SIKPIGADRKCEPAEIVNKTAAQHDPTGNWPDLGAVDKFVEMVCHLWMDRELAEIGRDLDRNDPDVCAPDAPAGGTNEADMVARMQVVLGEDCTPALVTGSSLSVQNLRVKMRLHETRPRTPNVEKAVAARLKSQKYGKQQADQNERQGRRFLR